MRHAESEQFDEGLDRSMVVPAPAALEGSGDRAQRHRLRRAVSELRLASDSIAGRRPYQEDAVLVETLPDGRTLVAVADGMGGHAAGEVASALALETLHEAVEGGEHLEKAFRLANERVLERSAEPGKHGMGTTLVALLLEGDEYAVANVGDSRAYLLDRAGIRQITEDHSFVVEAMKRGQSEEEAMASQWRDALTRSIGTDSEVEVDVFGPFPAAADTAVLLCSDGLYKSLSDAQLRSIFLQSEDPASAAGSLVSIALEEGSDDNITVAIAELGEVPRADAADSTPAQAPGRGPGASASEPTSEGASGGMPPEQSVPSPEGGAGQPGRTRLDEAAFAGVPDPDARIRWKRALMRQAAAGNESDRGIGRGMRVAAVAAAVVALAALMFLLLRQ